MDLFIAWFGAHEGVIDDLSDPPKGVKSWKRVVNPVVQASKINMRVAFDYPCEQPANNILKVSTPIWKAE